MESPVIPGTTRMENIFRKSWAEEYTETSSPKLERVTHAVVHNQHLDTWITSLECRSELYGIA